MSLFEKRAPVDLRALSALTASYVATDPIAVDNESMISLIIYYAPDTGGTGIEVLPEIRLQGAEEDDWIPAESTRDTGTPASGSVTNELLANSFVVTTESARVANLAVYGASQFRVRCRELGSVSVAGVGAVKAVASRVGA